MAHEGNTESNILPRDTAGSLPLTHKLLTCPEQIEAERSAWDGIVDARYGGNPFLTADWHYLWMKHFAVGKARAAYVKVMRQGNVAGYFPFAIERGAIHHIPARVLSIGGHLLSPVNCPILADPGDREVFDYVVREVLPTLGWDIIDISYMPQDYPGAMELRDALRRGEYEARAELLSANWICRNGSCDPAEYQERMSSLIRNQLRRYPKKLQEKGSLVWRIAGADLTQRDIEDYLHVFSRSWKEPEYHPEFYPSLMRVAAQRGWLRLGLLHFDGRPIAAQLWMVCNGWGYIVKLHFDGEFAKYSPGTYLTWQIIQSLMANDGMHTLDFLKGDDPYKRNWMNERRMLYCLRAFNTGLPGALHRSIDVNLLPWIRRQPLLNGLKRRLLARGGHGAESKEDASA